jgi:dipeptidyl-peptidase-4
MNLLKLVLTLAFVGFLQIICSSVQAQLTLRELPGYEQYRKLSSSRASRSSTAAVQFQWSEDGERVTFKVDGRPKVVDLKRLVVEEGSPASGSLEKRTSGETPEASANALRRAKRVPRAEQSPTELSPDGKWKGVYRDFNLSIEPVEPENTTTDILRATIQVTEQGTERHRFGTGCWVYGEELKQNDAMWWSPDSKRLAYYEIDERDLKDYHLTVDNTSLYTNVLSVRYPKAGDPNPQVGIWIYDMERKSARRIEFDGERTQYLFAVRFTPSGKELLVNRTNRRQDVLDLLAVDVETLKVRTVVTEQQETWQENLPEIRFLGTPLPLQAAVKQPEQSFGNTTPERFLWESEAGGWKHFQLRNLDGKLLHELMPSPSYPCGSIELIDESSNWVYFTAFSDRMPYHAQLHRAKLDGSEHVRLTSSPLHHSSFSIDPKHRYLIATREQLNVPPETVLYDHTGKELLVLTEQSTERRSAATAEYFSFPVEDGTEIWGTLHKPLDFDPAKKYPLLIDVYGGPSSMGMSSMYAPTHPGCEFGYLIAKIGNRGTQGRGKAFESANYLRLGGIDLDDQAAGVRHLSQRSYVDKDRVGIFGHSYGGYLSTLALLRYPDVFHAAVAGAPVTDFRNYDTIYTERYLRTPAENAEGYDFGSCVKRADQLRGKLLLVHGLIDDNVHPANTWQLVKALNDVDKRFQLMVYPEFKHGIGSNYSALRWEFFHQYLQRR